MRFEPYTTERLRFAYQYQVYLRWHTYRAQVHLALKKLAPTDMASISEKFGIRISEFQTDGKDILALVSLKPEESVSACASKLKGQLSRLIRERAGIKTPADILGRGYFACTAGKTTKEAVLGYLEKQGDHHHYSERVLPPVFTESYRSTDTDEERLNPKHACAILQFHIVLGTPGRKGVFGAKSGKVVSACWRQVEGKLKFALLKVSFVPEHVHLAVRVHPSVKPAELVAELMNAAAELMANELAEHMIHAGLDNLWQPSAYLGSYGDITSVRMRGYVEKWAGL